MILKKAKNKLGDNGSILETNDQAKILSMARKNAYFTWIGFLKVIYASRSGSDYRDRLALWSAKILFTHALGSMTERQALASELSLYKLCLNQMCGVYLIRIGKVADLRQSMHISRNEYADDFDNAYVYKFGRSNDVLARFKQHCGPKGYGHYSDTIQLTWFVITDEGKDVEAENSLKSFFDESNRRFEFTDCDNHRHDELVILKDKELDDTNTKYHSLIIRYRNTPNEIALITANARAEERRLREAAESALALSEEKLQTEKEKLRTAEEKHQREILEERRQREAVESDAKIHIMEANHQCDLAKIEAKCQHEVADARAQMIQMQLQMMTKRC